MIVEEAIQQLNELSVYFDKYVPAMGGEALRMGADALRAQHEKTNQHPCINCGIGWGSANGNGVTTCEETCEKFAAYMAQQERESNKPLTLEELREMDGEPVWVVRKREYADGDYGYCVMNDFIAEVPGISHTWFDLKDYGKTWLAYRHKPKEAEDDTDGSV